MYRYIRKRKFLIVIGLIYLGVFYKHRIKLDIITRRHGNKSDFIHSLQTNVFEIKSKVIGPFYVSENESFASHSKHSYLIRNISNILFQKWNSGKQSFCHKQFIGYGNIFAHLKNVTINPKFSKSQTGGENLTAVMMQSESNEYIKMQPGYFSLPCVENFKYKFDKKDHQFIWMKSIEKDHLKTFSPNIKRKFTIAVQRYEYVNMYHTMTDWYSVFLMCLFFGQEPVDTDILWIDAHPIGSLDQVWTTLFGRVERASALKTPVLYSNLIWSITGYFAPLSQHSLPQVPFIEDFRKFFLNQHGININRKLDCSKLNVLFIWRRDYVAHARNPKGLIKRKFENEQELLGWINKFYPRFSVEGAQMDKFSMKDQLQKIAKTDILIGMHGAGLSLTLFLPKHAGLIEFYPKYWPTANKHFKTFAKWRNLHYVMWQNKINGNEKPDYFTRIPPDIMLERFAKILSQMCPNAKTPVA